MGTIHSLPDSNLWSLQFINQEPVVFTGAKRAFDFYSDKIVCLLTGKIIDLHPVDFISELLRKERLRKNTVEDHHLVFNAFYELRNCLSHYRQERKYTDGGASIPLGQWIEFSERSVLDETFFSQQGESSFEIQWDYLSYENYASLFERGLFFLKRGDCYQYNLTFPFHGESSPSFSLLDFVRTIWKKREKRGDFAGLTCVNSSVYYSNSPECLFEIEVSKDAKDCFSYALETRPIKGTVEDSGDFERDWKALSECSKNESELFMITDLLRNDLNQIEKPQVEVLEKKAPLKVPGLLHSFSRLRVSLTEEVTLFDILISLFPGGSITGAPKKRVMEIIEELENTARGHYCGSTVIRTDGLFRGSINIRGGSIQGRSLIYHAGSGITYDSDVRSEYEEVIAKHRSFTDLFS